MRPFHISLLVLIALLVLADLVVLPQVTRPPELLLATTTSVRDSGLLDHLLPIFQKRTNIVVKVTAVGTGQALALGQRGDADVLIVHDP